MTETDEAELLGDPQSELNGVELTEDEIDTLLEGQDSSERIECSNLSEASCSSAADEVLFVFFKIIEILFLGLPCPCK